MTVATLQQKCRCEGFTGFSGKNKEGNSDTAAGSSETFTSALLLRRSDCYAALPLSAT